MSWRRIRAIAVKDVRAARRDARILALLLLPLVLALTLRGSSDDGRPVVHVRVAGPPALARALEQQGGASARVTAERVDARAAITGVRKGDADLGVIAPPTAVADLAAGRTPRLTLVTPRTATPESAVAGGLVDPALRRLAGQPQPAHVTVRPVATAHPDVVSRLGTERYTLLVIVVYLVVNAALIIVPTLVADEQEHGTLDALLLAGSPLDVGAAKALVGFAAVVVMLVLTVNFGDILPADNVLFGGAALLLAVALIGFGLLLGVLLRTSARVNTWMGLLVLPVVAPAVLIGLTLPEIPRILVSLTPTAQATRLLADGLTGDRVYALPVLSALGLVVWAVLGYALLARALARREA